MHFAKKVFPNFSLVFFFTAFLFLFSFSKAFARGGCFAGDVNILTPSGEVPISQLHAGDKITSYNFTTSQNETSVIGNVDVLQEPEYYIINHSIKVTPTHPFYVVRENSFAIVEVKDLKIGDQLFTSAHQGEVVSSLELHKQPLIVYNLREVVPNHSYFANGVLVHNKGGGGGGGGGGHYYRSYSSPVPYMYGGQSYYSSDACSAIIDPSARKDCQDHFSVSPLVMAVVFIVFIFSFIVVRVVKSQKYSAKRGKTFTPDENMVTFVKKVVPSFQNMYDNRYTQDTETWQLKNAPPALNESAYAACISSTELQEKIEKLFIQYQTDWTNRDFTHMSEYVPEPYFTQQKNIFMSSFGSDFDVVYQPKLLSATPVSARESGGGITIKFQMNGQMTNFEVSPNGTVMSGESYVRQFTEFWEVLVDQNKNLFLTNIQS